MPKNHKKKNIIFGLQFRHIASTTEEWKDHAMSADCSIDKKFLKTYGDYKARMQIVADCARAYISDNWKKVKDWSNLEVVIEDSSDEDEPVEYYNYIPRSQIKNENTGKARNPMHSEAMEKRRKGRHNPVKSFDRVILDTDGDFSVNINDRPHLWLSDDTVIIIADYIEKQLAQKI